MSAWENILRHQLQVERSRNWQFRNQVMQTETLPKHTREVVTQMLEEIDRRYTEMIDYMIR